MPVVKGGVWTNIEDEILKASGMFAQPTAAQTLPKSLTHVTVSKYGLNQWARVSSLLARKTPKQCKSRWSEWLDPSIRKIEWSKEEDEKLLHLAKLMPTQWRSIAPIVGRTATQCLERYQKLLDEAEAREGDEFGLGGPDGGEAAPPSADDVRRLRPGELDPDPESKPARPDTIDMDEDEKEMLSEARARLANTQGKKAKRKARERQLEESRRLAVLQKRRELKNAGINIKVTTRKPGQMDYNADIPFERAPAPGFFDTQNEMDENERTRATFDPRKQQLAIKRKGDSQEQDGADSKKRKKEGEAPSAAFAAAVKAGQMHRIKEAERSSKRKTLNLPAPQVGEAELEDIVKMGMAGDRAARQASAAENDATRGLVGNYNNAIGQTPIRTPRAPQEEDRVANEIRNARARTDTQSALLGGENTELYEGEGTTGYAGATPGTRTSSTPNPMATPRGPGASNGVGATPLRTPRDNFRLNDQTPSAMQLAGQTPREIKMAEAAAKNSLRGRLAALPKPKETDWELELPEEQEERPGQAARTQEEDAAIRDERNLQLRLDAQRADFARQTQVMRRGLPRPPKVDLDAMLQSADALSDPPERLLARETALLIANDARRFGAGAKGKSVGKPESQLGTFTDDELERARLEIAMEVNASGNKPENTEQFEQAWEALHIEGGKIPGLSSYGDDDVDQGQLRVKAFHRAREHLTATATSCNALEKKLALHLGGYQMRAKQLRQKVVEAADALEKTHIANETMRFAAVAEEAAISDRLERLRGEVQVVMGRERRAQDDYREKRDELAAITGTR
ncbi:hypothetical protein FH972_022312 [Carpinus fangiana]|uniref:Pre-mRNA-splicing factor cef1 n=1 Tax=Carpinus fangiana TaxID=176857 RepID=A0A5N6KS80_9ROSI|nr:hypothetical protein FH972_022312 [Carpinus fangiana]